MKLREGLLTALLFPCRPVLPVRQPGQQTAVVVEPALLHKLLVGEQIRVEIIEVGHVREVSRNVGVVSESPTEYFSRDEDEDRLLHSSVYCPSVSPLGLLKIAR